MKIIYELIKIILYPYYLIAWAFKKRNCSLLIICSVAIIYSSSLFYVANRDDFNVEAHVLSERIIISSNESDRNTLYDKIIEKGFKHDAGHYYLKNKVIISILSIGNAKK